jgi:hypothetical protein
MRPKRSWMLSPSRAVGHPGLLEGPHQGISGTEGLSIEVEGEDLFSTKKEK